MKALVALTLALSGAVLAVAAPVDDVHVAALAVDPSVNLPVEHTGNVAYLNGGAGLDEMAYLKSRSREFPLQVLFSGRGGEYVVADSVTVREGGREVASVRDAGPLLMLQVPPGRYTVEARFGDTAERRVVSVGQTVNRVNWNSPRASN